MNHRLNSLLLIVMLLSIVSVTAQGLPTQVNANTNIGYDIRYPEYSLARPNTTFILQTHVYNRSNGLPLDNSSVSCFLHLYYPDGNSVSELKMLYEPDNKPIGEFNVTILGTNFSRLGNHAYVIQCNSTAFGGFASGIFDVTPRGYTLTTAQVILYAMITFLVLSLLLLSLYFGVTISFSNERTFNGGIVKINWKKYLKIFCWAFFYFMLLTFTWLNWNLISAYSDWQTLSLLLKYLFYLEGALALPVLITIIIVSAVNFRLDMKTQEFISKFGGEYNG